MKDKPWLAKKEISHDKLDARTDNDSARYTAKIGGPAQTTVLIVIDKICYPPNICPKCKSLATFHRRMQQHGDNVFNIWRTERKEDGKVIVSVKYDFCLDCHSEFIFEMFILKQQ